MKKPLLLLSIVRRWLLASVFLVSAQGATDTESPASNLLTSPEHYFNDYASLINSQMAQQLNQRLEEFEQQTSNQILVVIYRSLPADTTIEEFALDAFHSWKPGRIGRDNGAILFVFVRDRKINISTGYGMEATLTNDLCKRIISDEIAPRFQQGNFAGGLTAAIDAMIAATRYAFAGTGKALAEQNAIDRRAAQGSPTKPPPTTILQANPTDVVDYESPQDEADILWIMKTRQMDRQTATITYNSQPDTWHRLHQLIH